ncbi:uncharacterized protein FOMMEDRAFT_158991 [Fomitiporia mediterranea MF3/22]|uniref:uncharacterized protein n=1 Tax=Fomitiporia mediterranea (strain MF3/22) TaxID=694068 RepID=UPI0004408377|nr:uncharacterized protein FOMMEDRAFT_158991 [Fomitiporia mediterranea MF3/22]EJD00319.1 hypothetical protein FOMMEDRAFT_158991 [Fomitiporia mediterranea MF3/22]
MAIRRGDCADKTGISLFNWEKLSSNQGRSPGLNSARSLQGPGNDHVHSVDPFAESVEADPPEPGAAEVGKVIPPLSPATTKVLPASLSKSFYAFFHIERLGYERRVEETRICNALESQVKKSRAGRHLHARNPDDPRWLTFEMPPPPESKALSDSHIQHALEVWAAWLSQLRRPNLPVMSLHAVRSRSFCLVKQLFSLEFDVLGFLSCLANYSASSGSFAWNVVQLVLSSDISGRSHIRQMKSIVLGCLDIQMSGRTIQNIILILPRVGHVERSGSRDAPLHSLTGGTTPAFVRLMGNRVILCCADFLYGVLHKQLLRFAGGYLVGSFPQNQVITSRYAVLTLKTRYTPYLAFRIPRFRSNLAASPVGHHRGMQCSRHMYVYAHIVVFSDTATAASNINNVSSTTFEDMRFFIGRSSAPLCLPV